MWALIAAFRGVERVECHEEGGGERGGMAVLQALLVEAEEEMRRCAELLGRCI